MQFRGFALCNFTLAFPHSSLHLHVELRGGSVHSTNQEGAFELAGMNPTQHEIRQTGLNDIERLYLNVI